MEKKFAQSILDAAEIREESYDNVAAETASRKEKYPDFSTYYRKTIVKSAEESCKKNKINEAFAEVIDWALYSHWNDIIDWAQRILGKVNAHEKKKNNNF